VSNQSVYNQWYYAGTGSSHIAVLMAAMSNDGLVTVDSGGCVRLWETAVFNLTKSLNRWRSMIGDASLQLNLQVSLSHMLLNVLYTVCFVNSSLPPLLSLLIIFVVARLVFFGLCALVRQHIQNSKIIYSAVKTCLTGTV